MSGPACLGSWIDGQVADLLPADDRGLHYGDGVFETILLRAGRARFLEAHLARLDRGLARLGIDRFPVDDLRADITRALEKAPALAVLKIIATRGSARRRGYAPRDAGPARRLVTLWPAEAVEIPPGGVEARIAKLRAGASPALAGLKHLNRLENVLAAAEAGDAFESLLLDADGDLVSGTMSNVFVVRTGRVSTPRVDTAGVAGVLRGVVLRECAALGIDAEERRISRAELDAADELFLTNVRIGVVPVRRLGEHGLPMSSLGFRLRQHVEALDA